MHYASVRTCTTHHSTCTDKHANAASLLFEQCRGLTRRKGSESMRADAGAKGSAQAHPEVDPRGSAAALLATAGQRPRARCPAQWGSCGAKERSKKTAAHQEKCNARAGKRPRARCSALWGSCGTTEQSRKQPVRWRAPCRRWREPCRKRNGGAAVLGGVPECGAFWIKKASFFY